MDENMFPPAPSSSGEDITFVPSKPPWVEEDINLDQLDDETIHSIIKKAFDLLSESFTGYQPRESQVKMAVRILKSLVFSHTFIVEAGTGVGKSFGYIIPAIAFSYICGERVVITTETKSLQMQLFEKDVAKIQNILDNGLRYELALGSSNYFCKLRHEETYHIGSHRDLIDDEQEKNYKAWVEEIASGRAQGHIFETKNQIPSDFWSLVSRDPDGCPGNRCMFFSGCNYFRVKELWNESRVLIANHHLFLYNILNEKRTLPQYGAVILDEAHGLLKTGQSIFTKTFHAENVREVQKKFERTAGKFLDGEARMEWDETYQRIESNWDIFYSSWDVELGLSFEQDAVKIITEKTGIDTENLISLIGEVIEKLIIMHEKAEDSGELNAINAAKKNFINVLSFLEAYKEFDTEKKVYWGEKRAGRLHLFSCNLGLGEELAPAMVEPAVWTSATLGYWPQGRRPVSKNQLVEQGYFQSFIRDAFGSEAQSGVKYDYYPSPFDYKEKSLVYIPDHIKVPAWGSSGGMQEAYEQDLFDEIARLTNLAGGGVLVLFTSHYMVRRAAEELIEKTELPVFSQSEYGAAGALDHFRNTPDSVLLGTNTYWQGIDISGRHLRMVIITKMMFTPPDDPVFSARSKILEEKGENPFMQLSLPNSAMMLRQAFGRLIRNEADSGVIAILDTRIMEKFYGKILLANLPDVPLVRNYERLEQIVEEKKLL
ncbi:MAG: ATP-dependent DNA helicase [Leptospirales bacterium]